MKKKYLLAIPMVAGAYAFLVAPRMINKPDVSVLKGVHYAHRGLHDNQGDAPENSMKAFQKAVHVMQTNEFYF